MTSVVLSWGRYVGCAIESVPRIIRNAGVLWVPLVLAKGPSLA